MKYYAYFFTRQDISPEQQVVQTAHAALKLGVNSQRGHDKFDKDNYPVSHQTIDINPNETYFTVVGVRNQEALEAVASILDKFSYRYEVFFEPDLNKGEITSIAVYPVQEDRRGPMLAFNLLQLNRK